MGDVGTEALLDVVERNPRVFDDVVQQRCSNDDVVEAELGKHAGDRDRMSHIGLAGLAGLASVGLCRQRVSPEYALGGTLGVVLSVGRQQRGDQFVGGAGRIGHILKGRRSGAGRATVQVAPSRIFGGPADASIGDPSCEAGAG